MDSSDFVHHYGSQVNQLHQQYVAQQHMLLNAYQFGGNSTRLPPFNVISYLSCSQCPHSEQDVPRMIDHVRAVHQNARPPATTASAQTFVPPLPTSSRLYPEVYSQEKGTNDPTPPPVKTPGPKPLFGEPNWKFDSTKKTIENPMFLPGLGKPINEDWNKAKAERQAVEESLSPRSKPDGLADREADASETKIAENLALMRRDEDAGERRRDDSSNQLDLEEAREDAKDKTGKPGKKKEIRSDWVNY